MVFVNLGYSKLDSDGEFSLASYAALATSSGSLPTWAIDPVTGEIKGGSYVDMKGGDLVNVRSILSANGSWSIDENGVLIAKEIRAEKVLTKELEVGDTVKPSGITIYDTYTKEPKCITVTASMLNVASGKCPEDTSGISPDSGLPAVSSPNPPSLPADSTASTPPADSIVTPLPPSTDSTQPSPDATADTAGLLPPDSTATSTETSIEPVLSPADTATTTAP